MHILYLTFFNICCLRLGPQDLPASSILLWISLFTYTIVSGLLSILEFPLIESVLISTSETFLVVVLTSSLLYATHHLTRLTQTLTALAGTNALLGIFSLLPLYWLENIQSYLTLPALLLLGLKIWNIIVYTHILRHALSSSFWVGLMVTIITFSLIISILYRIFPTN